MFTIFMNLLAISRASKASSETQNKDVLLPLPAVSAAQPAPKPAKMIQKRPKNETEELLAMDNPARNKSNHKDPLFAKHRKMEGNHTELSKGIKVGIQDNWWGVSSNMGAMWFSSETYSVNTKGMRIMCMLIFISDCRQLQVQYWFIGVKTSVLIKRKRGLLKNKKTSNLLHWLQPRYKLL